MTTLQGGNLDINRALTDHLVMHENVKLELVFTTADKLKLCLIEYRELLTSTREWLGPAGLFVSLVTTLVAAQFQAVWLSAETWKAIYIAASLLSLFWTVMLIAKAVRAWSKGGIDDLIDRIANRKTQGLPEPLADLLANIANQVAEGARKR